MKFVDEYRSGSIAQKYVAEIVSITTRSWTIMEICGGQTHSIVKYGIDRLLPPEINLIHGSGCPVCVTSVDLIDKAIALASQSEIIFCSFGDMCVKQLETGIVEVENQYARAVNFVGNQAAQQLMVEVFEETSRQWREIGEIEDSGLKLRDRYSQFNAEKRFQLKESNTCESSDCISGSILQGRKKTITMPSVWQKMHSRKSFECADGFFRGCLCCLLSLSAVARDVSSNARTGRLENFNRSRTMESQAHEIKQIAAQLLAGMLANPHPDRVYPTESGELNQEQQTRLIEIAVCMAESLIERSEDRIKEHLKHDFLWEEHNNDSA